MAGRKCIVVMGKKKGGISKRLHRQAKLDQ